MYDSRSKKKEFEERERLKARRFFGPKGRKHI
jgi:hypothetical protein